MKNTLLWITVPLMLVVTLTWAASNVRPISSHQNCLTQEDVQFYMERSKSGISLTCNEQIRLRNLSQMTAQ